MKVQERQGYCLLLDVENISYNDASMRAVFYSQEIDGFWKELEIAEGYLRDYGISDDGRITYKNKSLDSLKDDKMKAFETSMQTEKMRRKEAERLRAEEKQRLFEAAERRRQEQLKKWEEDEKERQQRVAEEKQRRKKEEAERQAEIKQREEDFKRNMESNFLQQKTPVRDESGARWIKCESCGLIAKESEFVSYGGANHVNLGTCKSCFSKRAKNITPIIPQQESERKQNRYDPTVCPECGGKLREKNGRFGNFMGCSNYPKCRFTRKIVVRRES